MAIEVFDCMSNKRRCKRTLDHNSKSGSYCYYCLKSLFSKPLEPSFLPKLFDKPNPTIRLVGYGKHVPLQLCENNDGSGAMECAEEKEQPILDTCDFAESSEGRPSSSDSDSDHYDSQSMVEDDGFNVMEENGEYLEVFYENHHEDFEDERQQSLDDVQVCYQLEDGRTVTMSVAEWMRHK